MLDLMQQEKGSSEISGSPIIAEAADLQILYRLASDA